jgi:hypothetical protein
MPATTPQAPHELILYPSLTDAYHLWLFFGTQVGRAIFHNLRFIRCRNQIEDHAIATIRNCQRSL